MIDKKGNVMCDVCRKYLGNINDGDGNYFALIKMKRCPDCQALFNKEKSVYGIRNTAASKSS